jgi:hypothetical protein
MMRIHQHCLTNVLSFCHKSSGKGSKSVYDSAMIPGLLVQQNIKEKEMTKETKQGEEHEMQKIPQRKTHTHTQIKQGKKILAELIKNPLTMIPTSEMGFPTTVWFKRQQAIPGLGSAPGRGRGELGLEGSCCSFCLYG